MQWRLLRRAREYPLRVLFCVVLTLICLQYSVNVLVHSGLIYKVLYRGNGVNYQSNFSLEMFGESNITTTPRIIEDIIVLNNTLQLPLCPEKPPHLVGRLAINRESPSFESIAEVVNVTEHGWIVDARWKPRDCRARQRVAIIISYRNREQHLRTLTLHLHPILQRQLLDYTIFVVEQLPGTRFNRAALFNVGFKEAMKLGNFSCFIFHDVDLLPEDDRNMYMCGSNPRHLSAAVDKFKYRLPYGSIFGGACALSTEQFQKVNGFSNVFFGWGGEDDDLYNRVIAAKYKISRYPLSIARYTMLRHKHDPGNKVNPQRFKLLWQGKKRFKLDGLSDIKYTLHSAGPAAHDLIFWIKVQLPEKEMIAKWGIKS